MRKNLIAATSLVLALSTAIAFAQGKGKARHPNLAAARRLTHQAVEKITAAQTANEFDMGGHAQKAKDLLGQAEGELKQAAEEATENKK